MNQVYILKAVLGALKPGELTEVTVGSRAERQQQGRARPENSRKCACDFMRATWRLLCDRLSAQRLSSDAEEAPAMLSLLCNVEAGRRCENQQT